MLDVVYKDVIYQYTQNGLIEALPTQPDINKSLYNTLLCPLNSRGFQPEYGALLNQYIFDPCDESTARKIEITYFAAIERWEPRIILNRSQCKVIPTRLRDGYDVILAFYIPSLDKQSSFSITVTTS